MWTENIIHTDPRDEKSNVQGMRSLLDYLSIAWRKGKPLGIKPINIGPIADMTGDRIGSATKYVRRVKKHFDPDSVASSTECVDPGVSPFMERCMPYLRPIVFSRPMRALVAKMTGKTGF